MDIHLRHTEEAHASAETLFEVETDHVHYPRFDTAVSDVTVARQEGYGRSS